MKDLKNTLSVISEDTDPVTTAAIEKLQENITEEGIIQVLKLLDDRHSDVYNVILAGLNAGIVSDKLFEQLYYVRLKHSYIFQTEKNVELLKQFVLHTIKHKNKFANHQLMQLVDTLECLIAKGVDIKKETADLLRSLESDMPNIAYSDNMLHIKMAIAVYGYCSTNKKDMFRKLDDIVCYIRSNKLHHIKGMMHYYLWRFKSMNDNYVFSHYSTWKAQEHLDKSYEKGFHLAKLT